MICQEEMVLVLLEEAVQEPEEVWEVVVAEAGWKEINLALAPVASVYVHPVVRLPHIKQEYPVIK